MATLLPSVTADDVRRVEDAVHTHRLPPYVDGFDVQFDSTWDGEPAVWVLFRLTDDSYPSQQVLDEMNALARDVRHDLYAVVPDRTVFVRFVHTHQPEPTATTAA